MLRNVLVLATALLGCAARAMTLQPCLAPSQFAEAQMGAEQQGRRDGYSDQEGVKQFLMHLAEPGHERMTILSMVDSDAEAVPLIAAFECEKPPFPDVIRGVRWNDDPAFHMKWYTLVCSGGGRASKNLEIKAARNPLCFGAAFARASGSAKTQLIDGAVRKGQFPHSLLARSHFGDLQFLHAMASQRDRNAGDTYARIMGWAELAYGVSIRDRRFPGHLEAYKLTAIPAMQATFRHNGWSIAYLFDNERDPAVRADIAFGTLLHVVQDSFAACHAQRDPTTKQLTKFYGYGLQDKDVHRSCDAWAPWMSRVEGQCHPVSLGREIRRLRDRPAPWDEVREVLEACLKPTSLDAAPMPSDECIAGLTPQACK